MIKKIFVTLSLTLLSLFLLTSCKISTNDLFYKGQEVEYINWCSEVETEKAVKENLLIKEYGDNELIFYISEDNLLRYVYITTDKYLQWEENGTFDLEESIVSEDPWRVFTKSGKYIDIILADSEKELPAGYDANQVSFSLNDKDYSIVICTNYVK